MRNGQLRKSPDAEDSCSYASATSGPGLTPDHLPMAHNRVPKGAFFILAARNPAKKLTKKTRQEFS
jgi:hypothetical protein